MGKRFTCSDPACGFSIEDKDQREFVKLVQMHGQMTHKMNMSEADIMKMVK